MTDDSGAIDPSTEERNAGADTGAGAQNVMMTQTSASTWDLTISETGAGVGRVTKQDDGFVATDAVGEDVGVFDSPELAMFGVVAGSRRADDVDDAADGGAVSSEW
jgi:IS4 transposase